MIKKILKKIILPDYYKSLKQKDESIELAFMDEMRVGLIPVIRRQQAAKSNRPIAPSQMKYEWVYVYSLVITATGELYSWIWSTVNKKKQNIFLILFKEIGMIKNYQWSGIRQVFIS